METNNSTSAQNTSPLAYSKKVVYVAIGVAFYLGGLATYPLLEQLVFSTDEPVVVLPAADVRTYEDGFNDAKKLVEESSLGKMMPIEEDIRFVSGIVTAIADDRVTIHDDSIQNPFEKSVPSDRVVVIDKNTKIALYIIKKDSKINTTETLQKVREIETKVLGVSELQIGDVLTVIAAENIKTSAEFTATEIQVAPRRVVAE